MVPPVCRVSVAIDVDRADISAYSPDFVIGPHQHLMVPPPVRRTILTRSAGYHQSNVLPAVRSNLLHGIAHIQADLVKDDIMVVFLGHREDLIIILIVPDYLAVPSIATMPLKFVQL